MRIVALALGVFAVGQSVAAMAANPPAAPTTQGLPSPSQICVGAQVQKVSLVSYFTTTANKTPSQAAQTIMLTQPLSAIFTTPPETFCAAVGTQPQCADPKAKTCTDAIDSCRAYANTAVNLAVAFFRTVDLQGSDPDRQYILSEGLQNLPAHAQVNKYLDPNNFKDAQNPIACKVNPSQPSAGNGAGGTNQPATVDITNFRVRGKSDDLYVDRGTDLFKSTTPATVNWTGTDKDNYNAKLTASLGYQFQTAFGEIVPYIAAYQSLTDAVKKPRVIDPNSNVAFGALVAGSSVDSADTYITNWFSAKPQYLFNTADRSEIGSVRLIYTPWIDAPINVNTFGMVPGLPGLWASLLFDLRNDSGLYTQRADTAAIAATNKDFDRVGSRFGLSLTNSPAFPSLTLTVAEVYLHGIAGYYRSINQFQSSLTYNLESNNYVGLTVSYQNGRDEDTAVAAHSYTAGLTVKY